jgi:hypothetical protein
VYARGNQPEIGSVLNFRPNPHMQLGHVAAVKQVVDSRHVIIDHANWASPGHISRGVDVVDVSANNDWSAVRVGLGHSGSFGSVYPTFGFIYARADGDSRFAANTRPVAEPIPVVTFPGRDRDGEPVLRRVRATIRSASFEEVAEMPVRPRRGLDLTMPFLSMDPPNRSLR